MLMISPKPIYRTALSITLLFATSNLFSAFAINLRHLSDGKSFRRTNFQTNLQTNDSDKRRNGQDDAELVLGKPIERNLAGNQTHFYKIVLVANQYLHVVVEQRGIDVVVALFAPDGKKVLEIDSPNGTQGPEPISFVAETPGNYRLEVRPLERSAPAERYEIIVKELHEATEADRNRTAAWRYHLEGEKLRVVLRDTEKALVKYQHALILFQSVGDVAGEALTLTDIGSVYRYLGETEKAIDFYKQSLPRWQTAGNSGGEAIALNYIGKIYTITGEREKAVEFYREALKRFRLVGGRSGEAEAIFNIAVYEKERGNLTAALSLCEDALNIIESLRANFGNDALRGTYFIPTVDFYEFYIDLLMRLHKQQPRTGFDAKALQASEQARARSLLETLAEANADIRQGVDQKLLERERSVQQSLAVKSERLTRISNDEKLKEQKVAAQKEVDELLTQYQEIEAQIRIKSPRYAALTQPVPLNVAEIQRLLDKDTVLLEYALGEKSSYLWLVTAQSLKSYELPKRAVIEEIANRVIAAITVRGNAPAGTNAEHRKRQTDVKRADEEYPKLAAELSKMLLGQIAVEIEGKRLLIVGDGVLQYAPFAALPKPVYVNETAEFGEPLVASNEIVSLPSASALSALRREETARRDRKAHTKTVAVFADPVFDNNDKRAAPVAVKNNSSESKNGARRGQAQKPNSDTSPDDPQNALLRSASDVGLTNRGGLRRLLASKDEAAAIRNAVARGQATVALGFDASRERVLASNLAEYRIVHFATHGLLNEENPELSGVVLSLVDERGKQQNGFLRLHEIFNLNLPVEMVVLSACRTGLGKKIKGEGLVGLTRGFMYAGAPRVVASLWSVDDRATAELMSVFYRKMMRDGLSPPAALREAQNEIRRRKEWRSPLFWAGFVMQGEWRAFSDE